ncbi:unnamed protein product [Blepharisma stoltei]|uniref:t-SNARE coiled-coil homology domain-containing protein n=1 Tax=Blepharisma stoltei TaxID=1481888 RepID=A0AAU9IQW9_9CILI|nr:unnamed protein product [Blepharisma stoltei]
MIDRLQELKGASNNPSHEILLSDPQPASGPNMQFMIQIRKAQKSIERVRSNTEQIRILKDEFNQCTQPDQEAKINKKLKELIDVNNGELNTVRDIAETLAKTIEDGRGTSSDTETRMRSTMHATLIKQFQQALGEGEKAQNIFTEAARNKTANQLRMVDENISDEVIEQCLEDPRQAQMMVEKKMIGAHSDIIQMVNSIESRLEDIKMLEQNINIMHRMFLDLAALVHSQGELLNSVEKHVDNASDYVKQAEKALEGAKSHQERARWKKCCILVAVLIIALVIVIPTVATKTL